MIAQCSCPTPFDEDSLLCRVCEQQEIDGLLAIDADQIPTGAAWDAFARQQG